MLNQDARFTFTLRVSTKQDNAVTAIHEQSFMPEVTMQEAMASIMEFVFDSNPNANNYHVEVIDH